MSPALKNSSSERTTERMAGFSDAIFAFAMTLLMLDIKVPDVPQGAASSELTGWILAQAPKLSVYVLSFVVIGMFWMRHHSMFRLIRRHDSALMWLNMLFLLVISLMPFPTAILGEYGDERTAVALYSGFMLAAGMLLNLIWIYATRSRRLVGPDLDDSAIRRSTRRGLAISCVFALSILLALFVSPSWATWCLVLTLFVGAAWREKEG